MSTVSPTPDWRNVQTFVKLHTKKVVEQGASCDTPPAMANVLITGGSGYLGGDLLAYLRASSPLPAHGTIYAMVRHKEQGEMVKTSYNATPLMLDISDEKAITDLLLEKKISIVFFLIDAFHGETQQRFLRALSEVGNKLNAKTHFLHTTGAKIVSSHVGTPTDRPLSDADGKLFEIQKTCRPPHLPKMREVRKIPSKLAVFAPTC